MTRFDWQQYADGLRISDMTRFDWQQYAVER
jgi:hypothetical protein